MTGHRASRVAVFLLFAGFGVCISTWAVHIPTVQQRTGISAGALGTMLLLNGAGALGGMQLSGPLVDRLGAGRVALTGALAMALTLALPLNAGSAVALAVGLLAFGVCTGITDVAMNARAVVVEQSAGKPIMSAFHAVFSVGTVLGSLVGAATLAAGWSMPLTSVVLGAVCGVAALVSAPNLLWTQPKAATAASATEAPPAPPGRRHFVLLGALAFLLYLAEGSATDWSSLHAQDALGTSKAVGALAFAAFVAAMTVGRFTADWVSARVGPVSVVRYGCAAAAIGMTVVLLSGVLPLTLFGWVVFGLGLSGAIPQVFSVAGNLGSATQFSRVVGGGYAAFLAGPAVIGWLADVVTLRLAMAVPLLAVLVCTVGARAVRPVVRSDAANLRSEAADPCT